MDDLTRSRRASTEAQWLSAMAYRDAKIGFMLGLVALILSIIAMILAFVGC